MFETVIHIKTERNNTTMNVEIQTRLSAEFNGIDSIMNETYWFVFSPRPPWLADRLRVKQFT